MNNDKSEALQETLPSKDSATSRALKTFVQALLGSLIGLVVAVWSTPGVPTVVVNYIQANMIPLILGIGVPSGLISLLWNLIFRPDLKKY